MPDYQVISLERHQDKYWHQPTNFLFCRTDAVAGLAAREIPKAMMALPIAFVLKDGTYSPVALLGLEAEKNLFVAKDGRWLSSYIPAVYRAYPFALANKNTEEQVLCIDEASGLITADPGGRPFFDNENKPAANLLDMLKFTQGLESNRLHTVQCCAILQRHNLIEPWPIHIELQNGDAPQKIEGLYRISESTLNALPAEELKEVRDTGMLVLAYGQLFSMQHVADFGALVQAHANAEKHLAQQAKPALGLMSESGTISFENL